MARTIAAVALLGGSLAACAKAQSAPVPTVEYRTPPPAADFSRPPISEVPQSPTVLPSLTPTLAPIPIATPPPETVESQSVASNTTPTTAPRASNTTPTTTSNTASSQYDGRCGPYPDEVARWWGEVTRYDWDPCTALYVIFAESGGLNVYNYQGSGACGVMQLLPCEYPDDGAANIKYGYWHKYVPAGWSPWQVLQ